MSVYAGSVPKIRVNFTLDRDLWERWKRLEASAPGFTPPASALINEFLSNALDQLEPSVLVLHQQGLQSALGVLGRTTLGQVANLLQAVSSGDIHTDSGPKEDPPKVA